MEFVLDGGRRGGGYPAIHVVEEVDAHHDGQHVAWVAAGHGGNYEVGLLGRRAKAPRSDCVGFTPLCGSAGHWRAQVAVNHPRKLWGFKSLPAHHAAVQTTESDIGYWSWRAASTAAQVVGALPFRTK